jgi:hypothetical protein
MAADRTIFSVPMDDSPHHAIAATLHVVRTNLDDLARRVQIALDGLTAGDVPQPPAPGSLCPRADRYRAVLRDAVQTLEKTRTSFKSKELGTLRRSLEATLYDDRGTGCAGGVSARCTR